MEGIILDLGLGMSPDAPIPFFLICLVVFLFIPGLRKLNLKSDKKQDSFALAFGLMLVAVSAIYGWSIFRYAWTHTFIDHVEPHIAGVGFVAVHGAPLYHPIDWLDRYSVYYGPLLYLATGAVEKFFMGSVYSTKILSSLLALVSPLLFFFTLRRRVADSVALLVTAIFLLVCLIFARAVSWPRAEPYLMFFTVLSYLAATLKVRTIATVAMAVSVAGLTSVKIHAGIYAAPALVILAQKEGWRPALMAGISGFLISFGFFLLPNVSLTNYFLWLKMASNHSFRWQEFSMHLTWVLFVCLPFMGGFLCITKKKTYLREAGLFLGVLSLVACFTIWTASKPGAEKHHVMSLIPGALFILADILQQRRKKGALYLRPLAAGILAFIVAAGARAYYSQEHFSRKIRWARQLEPAAEEIQAFIKANRETVGVMPTGDSRLINYRHVPVLYGSPFLLDENAIMDTDYYGIPIPDATFEALRNCRIRFWLSATGHEPFDAMSFYFDPGVRKIFDGTGIKNAFAKNHMKIGSGAYFDVWLCMNLR